MAAKSVEPQERENDATLDFESFKDDIVGVNLKSSLSTILSRSYNLSKRTIKACKKMQ
jgi:hypothetical protein